MEPLNAVIVQPGGRTVPLEHFSMSWVTRLTRKEYFNSWMSSLQV